MAVNNIAREVWGRPVQLLRKNRLFSGKKAYLLDASKEINDIILDEIYITLSWKANHNCTNSVIQ